MRAADDCGHVRAQKVQYAYRPEQVFAFLNGRSHLPFRRELLFKIVHSFVQDAILKRCMEADSAGAAVVGVHFDKSPPSRFLGSSDADRKSVVWVTRVSVRVDCGGLRTIKKKKKNNTQSKQY